MFKFLKQKNQNDGTSVQKFLLYIGMPLIILTSIGVGYMVEPGAGIFLFIFSGMMMCFTWDAEAFGNGGDGLD